MKLTFEDKKEIVRLYEGEHRGFESIAKKYRIQPSTIKVLIYKYKQHGIESLKHPIRNKAYSIDFKLMIIKEAYSGKTKTSLAAQYDLPGPGTICSWIKQYDELGYNGLRQKARGRPRSDMGPKEAKTENRAADSSAPLTSSERAEFEELKRNYEILKKEKEVSDMEVDLLKKLNALVQQRKQQQRKKK